MKTAYQLRQEKMHQKMGENGIAKFLITNPINILYLTGASIVPYERFMGLLLDAETQKSYLLIPEFEKGHCQEEGTLEVTYKDHEDALAMMADMVHGCKKLGVEKKALPSFTLGQLVSLLKQADPHAACDVVGADSFLEEMRLHKDETELEKMAQAARYTVDILEKVRTKLMPGVMEQEIKFKLLQQIFLEEALMGPASPIQVSSGIHSSMAHGIQGVKNIDPGDQVIIDFGVTFEHYRSDITRTFFVGKPKAEFQKIYKIVREAQQKAIDVVKPGIAIKEVDLAARRHIEKEGYGKYFTTRVGHGLGLEIHEPPSVHHKNEQLIEEGMVFTIEPGIYIPGLGGVRVEDDIAVHKDGAVVLTQYSKALDDVTVA